MLVCSVSLRPPRTAITAAIVEAASADATATGLAYFNTLIDEPATAVAATDASSDSFLLEAASASDTVELAGATYAATVDEATTAADTQDGTVSGAVVGRSAMLPRVFVNPGTSREAHVIGTMVNL